MKMKKTVVFLAAISTVGIACAGTIATPYVAGSMDGWAGPNSYSMTETSGGSDIWTLDLTGFAANERHEFKVTDGTWGTSVPAANSWFIADGSGNITITYDGNTYADGWSSTTDRIGLSYDPGSWTATGDFLSEIGGADWVNNDAAGLMTAAGGGIYTLTINDLAAGTYIGKPVVTGTWDGIGTENRSIDAWNFGFTTDAVNNDVTFYVDALTGTAKVEVIPEPATIGLIGIFGVGLIAVRRKFNI